MKDINECICINYSDNEFSNFKIHLDSNVGSDKDVVWIDFGDISKNNTQLRLIYMSINCKICNEKIIYRKGFVDYRVYGECIIISAILTLVNELNIPVKQALNIVEINFKQQYGDLYSELFEKLYNLYKDRNDTKEILIRVNNKKIAIWGIRLRGIQINMDGKILYIPYDKQLLV